MLSSSVFLNLMVGLIAVVSSSDVRPIVTLSHGGKLQGVTKTAMDTTVDLFLGVRYAQPPVGKLRFKKTEELPAWEGTVEASSVGNKCPQMASPAPGNVTIEGDEDCLFMDITVPGGVKPGAKMAVMVWIHGGGYMQGTGSVYIATPLAVTGNVIIVSINYRLGMLGFLSAGKGTGNYGLWDQRAVLIWVKKNIAQFGGDPDMVTIFGESAGGASVSCQTIGQHNDGLFRRAITQSGTAYIGGTLTASTIQKNVADIREQIKCAEETSFYDCFDDLSVNDIMKIVPTSYQWPAADDDFFAENSHREENYLQAHRFDLMAGVNSQEGGLLYIFEVGSMAKAQNISDITENGVEMDFVRSYLENKCQTQLTPYSPKLCAEFIIKEYKLEEATSNRDRAIRLVAHLGETMFDIDTIRQLEQHSLSDKSTYAYYFTEHFTPNPPNPLWTMPDWMKTGADHGDELPFLFGAQFLKDQFLNDPFWLEILSMDALASGFLRNCTTDADMPLSKQLMTIWTNFAKSGNPNKPVPLGSEVPEWPKFDTESNQFMELNSKYFRAIETPHKGRLERYRETVLTAGKLQRNADQATSKPEDSAKRGAGHDEL